MGLTNTKSPATVPRTKRISASMRASPLLRHAKTNSSNRNGADKAIEKGHPRTPPTAKKNMPHAVLSPPFQFMKAAIPNIVVYMAKLDGRKAAEAWNIPGLKSMAII